MADQKQSSGFKDLLTSLMDRRWYVTAIVLGLFILITLGIFAAILFQAPMAAAWKELLMLLLGAFIGSYGKIIDYYYSDSDKDKMLVQKMDEEDGISMSHTNDMKETNKPVTPLIPDAFVQGAAAASQLAVTENRQNFELAKDKQEHEQEIEKLKLEHEIKAHRYCEHEWGDADHDGHLECQKCGLFKPEWDDTH
jgi:hypothetical protein